MIGKTLPYYRCFCFLLIALGACAKGNGTQLPDGDNGYRFEVPTQSEGQAHELMALSRAHCVDAANCPESVGLLVVATPHALGMCTGFVVAPDMIMTNSHCIWEFIKENPRNCSGNLEIIFPDSGKHPSERAGCKEVIAFSNTLQGEVNSQDYAFVRLSENVSRAPLAVSMEGISENETLSVAKMNPVSTGSYALGELQVEKCSPVFKSWYLPQSDDPGSPLMVFAGCEIAGANSGSPLVDSKGQVKGIAQSRVPRAPDSIQEDLIEPLDFLSVVGNLGCIPVPGAAPRGFVEACSMDLSHERTEQLRGGLLTGIPIASDQAIADAIARWAKASGSHLEWRSLEVSAKRNSLKTVTVEPRCFHRASDDSAWLKKFRTLGKYQKAAQMDAAVPLWEARLGYNSRLQAAHRLEPLSGKGATLGFSPSRLHDKGTSQVTLKITGINPPVERTAELQFCR